MNKNLFLLLSMGLLAMMAALSLWYSYQYGRHLARLSVLHQQHAEMNRKMAIFQAMLNETLEYGKRNPAIESVIKAANLKWKSDQPATAPHAPSTSTPPKPSK